MAPCLYVNPMAGPLVESTFAAAEVLWSDASAGEWLQLPRQRRPLAIVSGVTNGQVRIFRRLIWHPNHSRVQGSWMILVLSLLIS